MSRSKKTKIETNTWKPKRIKLRPYKADTKRLCGKI